MAFGHAVKRGGFKGPGNDDDKIKGAKGDVAETENGGDGDDVLIMFGGNDQAVGGDGEDDLSGGADDDLLVGAIWVDDDASIGDDSATDFNGIVDAEDTFEQDDFSDDYNAEATFEANGTDTIWYYDDDPTDFDDSGVVDFIDLSATIDSTVDHDGDLDVDADDVQFTLNARFSYDDSTGALSDGDGTWFNVFTDAGTTAAGTVYVEVDGNQFNWDGDSWEFLA